MADQLLIVTQCLLVDHYVYLISNNSILLIIVCCIN